MAKRSPVRKASKRPSKKKVIQKKKVAKKAKTKIRVNPEKEYLEMMQKSGIATVSMLSQDECVTNIRRRISTGSLSLDALLTNPSEPPGMRGIPLSRVTEIFGPPHIGKSTILDQIFSHVQKQGGEAILADTEISRDRHYSANLGVDIQKLKYLDFVRGHQTVEAVIHAMMVTAEFWTRVAPDKPVIIGWDALAGTATYEEVNKGLIVQTDDDKKKKKAHKPGSAAKAMALASRLLTPVLKGTNVGVVILNHEYDKIDMGGGGFGKKRETYGGHGTRHVASVRVQLYNDKDKIKGVGGVVLGRYIVASIIKNRLGEHSRTAQIPMMMHQGTNNCVTLYDFFRRRKLVEERGSWTGINVDGEVFSFQGWKGLEEKCQEHEDLLPKLEAIFWRMHNESAVGVDGGAV